MVNELNVWKSVTSGDEHAFESLFNHYYDRLVEYARYFTRDVNVAEECVQDLFVKIWNNRETLGQPASVRHYLLKALRNTIFNKLNVRSKEVYVGSLDDLLPFDAPQLFPLTLEIPGEISEDMHRLFKVLTSRQREAIYLFYYQNLSYKELADVLGMNITGAYKLIYRALETLRNHQPASPLQIQM